jgi:hypothetical protein
MLIIRDNTGVTIKSTIQSENHVRIGIFKTILWVDGVARSVRYSGKPHGEFDLNDCADLLDELDRLEKCV